MRDGIAKCAIARSQDGLLNSAGHQSIGKEIGNLKSGLRVGYNPG